MFHIYADSMLFATRLDQFERNNVAPNGQESSDARPARRGWLPWLQARVAR